MSDPIWFSRPSVLWRTDRIRELWPSTDMTPCEKNNALARFALLSSILILALRKGDLRVLLYGLCAMTVLMFIYKKPHTEGFMPDAPEGCHMPTHENPFGNVLVHEIHEGRAPACDYQINAPLTNRFFHEGRVNHEDIWNSAHGERQFYPMPNRAVTNDQGGFAQYLFGQGPNCKSDPSVCTGFDYGPKSNVPPPGLGPIKM